MADEARDYLLRQFDTAWALTQYHLEGLTTEECLWRPAQAGLHVRQEAEDEELRSAQRTRWPFQDRPFGDVIAWANVELTKNAAELGYARFLYAVSRPSPLPSPRGRGS
ncbi:MAG TPA: hypothetical protein VEU33_29140 [Archangium sp.]|nr:hypothetical protein [Archangium sp.]